MLPAIHGHNATAVIESDRCAIAFVDIDRQRAELGCGMFDEHTPDTAPLRRGIDEKPADVIVDQRDEALRPILRCERVIGEVEIDTSLTFSRWSLSTSSPRKACPARDAASQMRSITSWSSGCAFRISNMAACVSTMPERLQSCVWFSRGSGGNAGCRR